MDSDKFYGFFFPSLKVICFICILLLSPKSSPNQNLFPFPANNEFWLCDRHCSRHQGITVTSKFTKKHLCFLFLYIEKLPNVKVSFSISFLSSNKLEFFRTTSHVPLSFSCCSVSCHSHLEYSLWDLAYFLLIFFNFYAYVFLLFFPGLDWLLIIFISSDVLKVIDPCCILVVNIFNFKMF